MVAGVASAHSIYHVTLRNESRRVLRVNDLKCVKLNWLDKNLEADGDLYRTRARSQMNEYILA